MSMIGARDRLYDVLTGPDYAAAVAALNAAGGEYAGVTIAVFDRSRAHKVQETTSFPFLMIVPVDATVEVVEHSGRETVTHAFRVIVEDKAPNTDAVYSQIMAHAAAVRYCVHSFVRTVKYWHPRVPGWDFSDVAATGQGAFIAQVELRVEIQESLLTNDATD